MCGPFEKVFLGGSSYFVSFIDDYSRKVWIYLLNRKSEVFLTFKISCTCVGYIKGETVVSMVGVCDLSIQLHD